MFKEALRPAWVEINLSNLEYNFQQIRSAVGKDKKIIAVVKADGYGHGAETVSKVLLSQGADALAVATLAEAVALRRGGFSCPVIMLGLTPAIYADTLAEYDILPVTASYENACAISEAAKKAGKTISLFTAVDTGMGRVGFLPSDESIGEIKKIASLSNIKIFGLFSHFSSSDEADKTYTYDQLLCFNDYYSKLRESGIETGIRTIANSAAVMELPDTYFDAVRPGIILYGCHPSDESDRQRLNLKPVMSVKAAITQLKTVPPGSFISYGRRFQTKRESLIGTLALGYADGYPRALNGSGRVIVNGHFAPVVGNICMDQCMVDLTDIPGVIEGTEVILMGSGGTLEITADEIGKKTNTINYEIVCAFGQRLPKVYVK